MSPCRIEILDGLMLDELMLDRNFDELILDRNFRRTHVGQKF